MTEWRAFLKFIVYTLGLLVFALFIASSFIYSLVMERNANIVAGPPTSYSYAVGQELDNWLKSNNQSSTLTIEEDTLSAIAAIQYSNEEVEWADPDSINVGFVAQRVNADEYDDVVSLGTIASLPLLIFARADLGENLTMRDLANKQVSIGVPGSDVNQLMVEILNTTGYSATVDVRNEPSGMGVEQLLAGEVDAVALLTSLGAPVVRELAANPDLTIVNLDRSSALAFQLDYAQPATIPPAFIDYARGIPNETITTVAVELTVIASRYLDEPNVLLIARQLSVLDPRMRLPSDKETYPTFTNTQFLVSDVARDFYRNGVPWHYEVFPPALISWLWIPISRVVAVTIFILVIFRLVVPQLKKLRFRSVGAEVALDLRLLHLERQHRKGKALTERQVRELNRLIVRIDNPKPDPDKKIKKRALFLLGKKEEVAGKQEQVAGKQEEVADEQEEVVAAESKDP